MLKLKNEKLSVEVDQKGAQLTHVINNVTGFDYIWNGAEWPKHAPILFPAIGRSANDEYLLDGKKYPMQQHGFASDYDFDLVSREETKLILSFQGNEETRKSYPFAFELTVAFELIEDKLSVNFTVKNADNKELSFALGFHPAFNLPGEFTDYHLALTPEQELRQFEIIKTPAPYRTGNIVDFAGRVDDIALNHSMFDDGLIIFDNQVNKAQISSTKSNYSVRLDLVDFPYLCLWTKEDEALPYLCVEPFSGLPDIVNKPQELLTKEGNLRLKAGKTKSLSVIMKFGGN